MIHVPLIDELRDTRRRLAEACGEDIELYAQMLREVAQRIPGTYVTTPLTHDQSSDEPKATPRRSA
jgi:hypothetical protein